MHLSVKSRKQGRTTLYSSAKMQRPAFCTVPDPAVKLVKREIALCFLDGAPADSAQHQLVPYLV
jgi:hypothetical protein